MIRLDVNRKNYLYFFYFIALGLLASCARAPLEDKTQALLKSDERPILQDDLGKESLVEAVQKNIAFLEKSKRDSTFTFGKSEISKEIYIKSLYFFLTVLEKAQTVKDVEETVHNYFDFYSVYGIEKPGEVFITSYYQPIINGSRKRSEPYVHPVLIPPEDLVLVDLSSYASAFPGISALSQEVTDKLPKKTIWRGRLVKSDSDYGFDKVMPYFSRNEIVNGSFNVDPKKVIAWVDPIDLFFMQIQGSGTIILDGKEEIRVGYAAQNGHPYVPIGKYLTDFIPLEDMSMQKIEKHLRSINERAREDLLSKNPSYVFFRETKEKAVTYLGIEAFPGRTIATDYRYFTKGALAFLRFKKPVFSSDESFEPDYWQETSRFVIDQDTGGAIRGGGRLDLYWGKGLEAERHAGVLKGRGELYYLVPNERLIAYIQENQKKIISSNF